MGLPETRTLARRHLAIRDALLTRSLDALIVTTPANVAYLTNHRGSAGMLVVTPDAMHLLVDFRYQEAIRLLQESSAACPSLQTWAVPNSYDEALLLCLLGLGVKAVGFEEAHLTFARYAWLGRAIEGRRPDLTLHPTARIVEAIRLRKDDAEIQRLREAGRRLSRVADAAFSAVRPGVAERSIAAVIEHAIRDAGYDGAAFDTIVASGPNGALPHYRAGDRLLEHGDLVVLDFGGILDGYCCDLTRTVAVGQASPDAHRVHGAVRAAQQAAFEVVRPGVAAHDVDRAARTVLEQHGLGDAFGHGTGHGLGLEVHEEPRIGRPRPDDPGTPLESGMVFTIEPGAYLPGWGGVRIEDDVLVTEGGCDVLTSVPRELLVLT